MNIHKVREYSADKIGCYILATVIRDDITEIMQYIEFCNVIEALLNNIVSLTPREI